MSTVLPMDGAVPPPPMPDIAGLQQMLGGAPAGPSTGESVAGDMQARLKPVYRMVGELVDYLLTNPDVAPAARSIIQMSFGATRGMKSARQRAEGGPQMGPAGPTSPGAEMLPPPPPAPIPGLPMAPNMGRAMGGMMG